jgi:hypothetical protein
MEVTLSPPVHLQTDSSTIHRSLIGDQGTWHPRTTTYVTHSHEIKSYAYALRTILVFGGNAFLVGVFLQLFFTGLAWTGSLSEIRCCNEAVHI